MAEPDPNVREEPHSVEEHATDPKLQLPSVRSGIPAAGSASSTTAASGRRIGVSSRDRLEVAGKAASFLVALFLFVLAIQLMKSGAKEIAPALQDSPLFSNGVSTLGAGWLGAYVVLSGSPIAAVSLGLFAGGALTRLQTFTMLSGSRLGASFIVLLVGFLYSMRNRGANRKESVGMGVLALSLTALVYLPGMVLGYWLLKVGALSGIHMHASKGVLGVVDVIWGPALDLIRDHLPGWLLLPIGLGIILISFRLLDHVLPEVDAERTADARARWLKRPWPMFLLGCLVATITLSVSVALTVLVPLASRGYVKREESIPYIMGANITTLADTLVAAMLLGNPVAVQIVLAEAIGVSVVSLVYLGFFYGFVKRQIMALDDWVVGSARRLSAFVVILFVLPLIFLTSGIWIGPIAR